MIKKETIDKIFDTARIEDVVGDFVPLKKRGVNLLGLCPFHNEKTPSFNVNPARNIFKCFGCGKGGTAVNFIMEHEHSTYPDALRYLAKKYNIEIEEEISSPEENILRDEKESMLVLNAFAQKYFSENLFDREEGKAIGLSYFKERGFSNEIIKKFQLGYSLNGWDAFANAAADAGFQKEFLIKTGLAFAKESAEKNSEIADEKSRLLDRFRGRVMFPIHNLSGRIIAFGGRILKKDDKTAKYINSPESEVYHKSNVLYGIYFAKTAIIKHDNCFLVEGYTDVISLHQNEIENVVASAGTSLTVEQIRLIRRYTSNITILYDGDPAGIKASMRGIDLILEEGLNVKVVLFPDGDDPDSFSRKHSNSEVHEFISKNSKDFVVFKTSLLLDEVKNDPVRKAGLIREIVETIAKIPDQIIRATYVKHCSSLMDISEQILLTELNKIRRSQLNKNLPTGKQAIPPNDIDELMPEVMKINQLNEEVKEELLEREIVRVLLNYGNYDLKFYDEVDSVEHPNQKTITEHTSKLSEYIITEIEKDHLVIANELFVNFFNEIAGMVKDSGTLAPESFYQSQNPEISSLAVELLTHRHFLSENWEKMHKIPTVLEDTGIQKNIERLIYRYKKKRLDQIILDLERKNHEAYLAGNDHTELMVKIKEYKEIHSMISTSLGTVVLK